MRSDEIQPTIEKLASRTEVPYLWLRNWWNQEGLTLPEPIRFVEQLPEDSCKFLHFDSRSFIQIALKRIDKSGRVLSKDYLTGKEEISELMMVQDISELEETQRTELSQILARHLGEPARHILQCYPLPLPPTQKKNAIESCEGWAAAILAPYRNDAALVDEVITTTEIAQVQGLLFV